MRISRIPRRRMRLLSPGFGEMPPRRRAASMLTVAAAVLLFAAFRFLPSPTVEVTDFAVTTTPTSPAYVADVKPASHADIKEFRIPITHRTIEVAPGVLYQAWTFGNTVPGPVIRVRQGDRVRVVV